MSFALLAGAKRELWTAASYYDKAKPGLGDEFLDEVVAALNRLESWPRSGHPTDGGYRRRLVRRFPYALVYRIAGDKIVVLVAVVHLKCRPRYWLRRARREDV